MGGRPPETTDGEYLLFIAKADAPLVFTSAAAAEFDVSQQGAFSRLADLRDHGLLDSKTGQETAWWLTDRGAGQTDG